MRLASRYPIQQTTKMHMKLQQSLLPIAFLLASVQFTFAQTKTVQESYNNIDKIELLRAMYFHAAEQHARYWNDPSLLQQSWMRNSNWFKGCNRHTWELSMEAAKQGWQKARQNPKLKFPPGFVEVVDASFANSSWQRP